MHSEAWAQLTEELECWRRSGTVSTFWWRDDDAVEATPQLERLLRCADSIPVALAVIPGRVRPTLVERIGDEPSIAVLQHGWEHVSHLPGSTNEYPPSRTDEEVSREFFDGRSILRGLFGDQALPIFVPPWHAFDSRFMPVLTLNGLRGISRKGPRGNVPAAGLIEVNAHVSPIVWSTPPAFAGDGAYLEQIVEHLRGRRTGSYDPAEATGLLTHHLDQNDASFEFIARLAELISVHPGAAWLSARDLVPCEPD